MSGWQVSIWEDCEHLGSATFATQEEADAHARAQATARQVDISKHRDEYPEHIEGAAYVETPEGKPAGGWGWDASSVDTVDWA